MDEKYMELALELALKGKGKVNPNPLVGAIVVKDGKIIGKGYHKFFGGPHAEVYALDEASFDAEGATLYVTLEPCSHFGKTPPCVEKIKKMKIKKCVIATLDPNPLVAGRGKKILEEAGIEVVVGVCEKKALEINKVFFKYIQTKKPYLFLKCAITLDGKIATSFKDSKWITNEKSRKKVQHLRNEFTGIMIGINTLLNDNPRLTARIENGRDPYRIVIDPNLKTPLDSNFVNMNDKKSIIVTSKENSLEDSDNYEKYLNLCEKNIKFIFLSGKDFSIDEILDKIGELKIDSVLLEGGSYLISRAFKEDRIDGGEIFIAPKILGGGLPFIDGFNFKEIKDCFHLENIRYNIIDDNISIEFFKNVKNNLKVGD
ncbi:bifunctional diaminohydroxyphosphoribosylaminopyrimidine deaminase/5-amino-6-(5-phosphoribosylamino)uracil reductase RibD [Fusobacterium sp.]|uniref:bifunctional diaminohydroxyphosphoribosylaminopyrimidine deaminase/5-amino-6-(5-phosphoribosylamino)uracil reductase RibD n=1 Tax=Fusobacterium sp. TaxID=68766 RepID=UPI00260C7733|nr:bifunctional diaminohydroxyphosphoribosylaminopyrimidine deaminase/5-amino-6-(5-phosphoribosylamino)uracil reductase RibD [Fusobacterium sp.]